MHAEERRGEGVVVVRSRSALSVATVSSVCRLPPFRTGKRISGSRLTPTPARLPARSGLPGGLMNSFTCVCDGARLQALVYDILPPPTALTDYTVLGLENRQLTDSFSLVLSDSRFVSLLRL